MTAELKFADNLSVRPAQPGDSAFLQSLYRATRDDLRLIDAEEDFIEALIDHQHFAQGVGYGESFPNAIWFVIELLGERIGRAVVDFGPHEVRLVDIAFIPAARGKGHGKVFMHGLQRAAALTGAPLALTVSQANPLARQFYLALGFRVEEVRSGHERMVWYPTSAARA